MLNEIVTIVSGGAAGAVAGAIAAHRYARARTTATRFEDFESSEFPEDQAREMARRWRLANNLPPEAENIVLSKLKLGWNLHQSRSRRTRGWR